MATAGFIAEGFVASKTAGMLPESLARFQGPLHTVAGVVVVALSNDKNVQAAGKGLAVGGAVRTAKTFAPEGIRNTFSLNGIGTVDEDFLIDEMESFNQDFNAQLPIEDGPAMPLLGVQNEALALL
ncbi:MAG: hypothetical protein AAGI07_00225 [Bacteroidota bacterium]